MLGELVAALGLSATPVFAQDKKPDAAAAAKAETLSPEMFKIMDPAVQQLTSVFGGK